MQTSNEEPTNAGRIRNLNVGEHVDFPIEKIFAIRTAVSNINLMRGHKSLTTKASRADKLVTVTRVC